MKVFRFNRINNSPKITVAYVVVALFSLLIISNVTLPINKHFVFFVSSLIAFLINIHTVRRASKLVLVLQIDESLKLSFQNNMTKPVSIELSNLKVFVSGDKVVFESQDGRLIGIALKSLIEESFEWENLLIQLRKSLPSSSLAQLPHHGAH